MQTMTSAYANKMLKSLEEDKVFWVNKEAASAHMLLLSMRNLLYRNMITQKLQLLLQLLMRRLQLSSLHLM